MWSTLGKDMLPYNVIQRGYGGAKLSDLQIYADRILYPHQCQLFSVHRNDITGSEADKSPLEVSQRSENLYIIRRQFRDTLFLGHITPTPLRWMSGPK
jgi:hypothetical protein